MAWGNFPNAKGLTSQFTGFFEVLRILNENRRWVGFRMAGVAPAFRAGFGFRGREARLPVEATEGEDGEGLGLLVSLETPGHGVMVEAGEVGWFGCFGVGFVLGICGDSGWGCSWLLGCAHSSR
jgi:hypothetical protein